MAKILIVDDEQDLAETIGCILNFKGHEVKSVMDGYKAIEEIRTTLYDLVLMDIKMPGINGVETFLKMKEINPSIKVIMMTGFSVDILIKDAIRQGASGCVNKPFNPKNLIATINDVLGSTS